MSNTTTYRVKDVWRTVQGEGFWTGRAAVFVRLVGCNMWSGYEDDRERDAERHEADCPRWCDTDFTKEGSADLTAAELVGRAREAGADRAGFLVLTGGEPLLQADAALMRAFRAEGWQVAVETNGTCSLEAFRCPDAGTLVPPHWITVSPKLPEGDLAIEHCHEVKLVVPDYRPGDYPHLTARCRESLAGGDLRKMLWLQPEDGPRFDEATRMALRLADEHPAWRAGVQAHKVLGAA